MAMTEKNALGRVLMISREAYGVYSKESDGSAALLDSLSAALSHCGNAEEPLGRLMGKLKREIKAKDRALYPKVKRYFSRLYPVLDYDFDKACRHIPAMIFGNDSICAKLVAGECAKAQSMCDAMKSYPGFLFGDYEALTYRQFYELVFGYYPKLYDEEFMDSMSDLFGE